MCCYAIMNISIAWTKDKLKIMLEAVTNFREPEKLPGGGHSNVKRGIRLVQKFT